jgi:hypothetical protein
VDTISSVNLESGEIVFPEIQTAVIAAGSTQTNEPLQDRSYRIQFGGEQVLPDGSSIEMMAFFDTISGHGVGLLAIPIENSTTVPEFKTIEQKGQSRGLRVTYKRRLTSFLEGTAGYAVGEGQCLSREHFVNPRRFFSNGTFHIIAARVDANFVRTGTRISTVLRVASDGAVLAIDPFQGQISTYDPNISVLLNQELSSMGFGHWAAFLDLRNLLDQQASISNQKQQLIAGRYQRLIRVGVSLRF